MTTTETNTDIKLGIRRNLAQFALLVIVNAFVGAMVGLERTILPAKAPDQVSWYRPHLERSLEFIERARLAADAAIIDVGGGSSTLVDDLLARGYRNVTVLDISAAAIDAAKARLGERASGVRWLVADVTEVDLGAELIRLLARPRRVPLPARPG